MGDLSQAEQIPQYNPAPQWQPPSVTDVPLEHNGAKMSIPAPRNQYLFQFLKGLSDTRLRMDKEVSANLDGRAEELYNTLKNNSY